MPVSKIFKIDEVPVRRSPVGAVSRSLVNNQTCGSELSIGTVQFPVGHAVDVHKHNCNETVVVLEGDCEVEIAGECTRLKPFDTVHVEVGTWHCFRNKGTTPFTILTVYDDKEVIRTFRDAGESVREKAKA